MKIPTKCLKKFTWVCAPKALTQTKCLRASMRNSGDFKMKCASLRALSPYRKRKKLSNQALASHAQNETVDDERTRIFEREEKLREFDVENFRRLNLCRCRAAAVFGRWSRSSWPTWPTACATGSWRIHWGALVGKTHRGTAFGGRTGPGHFALAAQHQVRVWSPPLQKLSPREALAAWAPKVDWRRARASSAADLGHLTGRREESEVVGGRALRLQRNAPDVRFRQSKNTSPAVGSRVCCLWLGWGTTLCFQQQQVRLLCAAPPTWFSCCTALHLQQSVADWIVNSWGRQKIVKWVCGG